jgi:hypothetical protein
MTEEIFRRELSTDQVSYLVSIASQNDLLEGLTISGEKAVLGSREAIERLRGQLTELVAKVGFDEDYAPTAEGELIEHIIDALYLP